MEGEVVAMEEVETTSLADPIHIKRGNIRPKNPLLDHMSGPQLPLLKIPHLKQERAHAISLWMNCHDPRNGITTLISAEIPTLISEPRKMI
jgi:hypothetical protein